jgi:hypothetical protein
MGEPTPQFFQLAPGARTYNGSTKPEDLLEDYSTAVNIAGGNHRCVVRYVPQMLEGPARIWLNNLPAGSINGWMDFEEQFVSNFTSTYKRPNRPQQLANCRQGDYETDRDYQQKLQREMPATLAKTIKIADSYALGDPMQPTLASSGQGQGQRNNSGAGASGQFYRPDNQNKRRDDRPDYRYGSSQVAAVEQEQAGRGSCIAFSISKSVEPNEDLKVG